MSLRLSGRQRNAPSRLAGGQSRLPSCGSSLLAAASRRGDGAAVKKGPARCGRPQGERYKMSPKGKARSQSARLMLPGRAALRDGAETVPDRSHIFPKPASAPTHRSAEIIVSSAISWIELARLVLFRVGICACERDLPATKWSRGDRISVKRQKFGPSAVSAWI